MSYAPTALAVTYTLEWLPAPSLLITMAGGGQVLEQIATNSFVALVVGRSLVGTVTFSFPFLTPTRSRPYPMRGGAGKPRLHHTGGSE